MTDRDPSPTATKPAAATSAAGRATAAPRAKGRSRGHSGAFVWILMAAAVCVIVALWSGAHRVEASAWSSDIDTAILKAGEAGKPIFVLFSADWCGACKQFEREVLENAAVQNRLENFVLLRMDLTDGGGATGIAARKLGVRAIPTLLVFDSKGQPVELHEGALPVPFFIDWLSRCESMALTARATHR